MLIRPERKKETILESLPQLLEEGVSYVAPDVRRKVSPLIFCFTGMCVGVGRVVRGLFTT